MGRPTASNGPVRIRRSAPEDSHAALRVADRGGRLVARIAVPESDKPITGQPRDREGKRLAAGTYFVVLQVSGDRLVRKLVLKQPSAGHSPAPGRHLLASALVLSAVGESGTVPITERCQGAA